LTVNANGTTTFAKAIGASKKLMRLAVSNQKTGGRTVMNGASIDATTVSILDALTLGADVTVNATTATFSTVDGTTAGAQTLVANVSDKTTFNGSIGANTKLMRLATDAAGTTNLNASTTTATAADFQDTVILGADATINAETVSFRKTLDADTFAGGRSLTLNVSGLLTFGDAVGGQSKLNNLLLTSPAPLTTSGFSIAYAGKGDFTVTTLGEFAMGQGEKLINPYGGMYLTAGRKIVLGDVVVNGNLKIDPPEGTFIYGRNPTGAPGDTGVNIIAKSISFDRQLQFVEGSPQKVNFETESGSVTGLVEARGISFYKTRTSGMRDASFAAYAEGLTNFLNGTAGYLAIQLLAADAVAGGQKFLREAEALAGALAEQRAPDLNTEASISAAKIRELQFLGIYARLATSDELQSIAERRGYLAQLIEKLEAEAQEYQVVVNRVTKKQVDDLLASFDELFYRIEGGEKVDRHAELQQSFSEAYNAYLATGAQSPARFKAYLEAQSSESPAAKQVLEDMNKARALFGRLDRMGLTPREAQLSKESIILDMGIDVMTPRELRDLVEPHGDIQVIMPPLNTEAVNKPDTQGTDSTLDALPKIKKNKEDSKPAAQLKKVAPRISKGGTELSNPPLFAPLIANK
jgi:hypothetical protein